MINDEEVPGAQVNTRCNTCAYRKAETPLVCEAFPAGIPTIILLGLYDHSYSYDMDGVTDGGLTYTPEDKIAE